EDDRMADAVAEVSVPAVSRAVIRADDGEDRGASPHRVEDRRQMAVDVSQRRRLSLDRIALGAGQKYAIRLVQRGNVDEQEDALRLRETRQNFDRESRLILGRAWVGHAESRTPMAFGEEARQHASERVLFVEKSHAPNADRVIAAFGQARHDVRRVEDAGLRRTWFATLEPRGEQSWMRAGRDRRWQKSGEEGMVRGVSEIARRVALLPGPARQQCGQMRRPPYGQSVARHVVAQRVQRD